MKLRLRENSIRLRLLQTEVRQLMETGNISERIAFGIHPTETLTYSLKVSEDAETIFARIKNNHFEIFLPSKDAKDWADSAEIGLYAAQLVGETNELKITVEKDFVCLDRPNDEDNKDAYPHPKTTC